MDGTDRDQPRQHRMLAVLERLRRILDRILSAVCILLFAALVVIVAWQVFTRQMLHDSATWTEEAARYTFIVLALLGAVLVFSERGHIAVEVLIRRFPHGVQKVIAVVIQLVVIFFAIFVFVLGGSRVAENAWNQALVTLPVTAGQVYLILPISGVLITLYCLYHLFKVIVDAEDPTPVLDHTIEPD